MSKAGASPDSDADLFRSVDLEFCHNLETLSTEDRPMPGSFLKGAAIDPRLTGAKVMIMGGQSIGPKEGATRASLSHLATVRHRPTGKMYMACMQSYDALMAEQPDEKKYPRWLWDTAFKQLERKIYIQEVLRKPSGPDDRSWTDSIADDRIFESIFYYLKLKGLLPASMFDRG